MNKHKFGLPTVFFYMGLLLFPYPSFANSSLDFGVSDCSQAKQPTEFWTDEGVLVVERYIHINCGYLIPRGDFSVHGNKLSLVYFVNSHPDLQTQCYCARKLTFKISGINKSNYQIELTDRDR